MIRQLQSRATSPNPNMRQLVRGEGEGNLAWGERAVKEMATGASDSWSYVALLGGSDLMAFRLRVAQSHLRGDMLPSFWSEAILVRLTGTAVAKARAIHVPLLQPETADFATTNNGVVERALRDFDDPERYPNIALIAVPVAQADLLKAVDKFRKSRTTLDALEHSLRWLAFVWGTARTGNPLHENFGLPSACMLEAACAAAGVELTPGLESRACCPEAIWVAALHWHLSFKEFNGKEPVGRYCTPHAYPIEGAMAGRPGDKRRPRR